MVAFDLDYTLYAPRIGNIENGFTVFRAKGLKADPVLDYIQYIPNGEGNIENGFVVFKIEGLKVNPSLNSYTYTPTNKISAFAFEVEPKPSFIKKSIFLDNILFSSRCEYDNYGISCIDVNYSNSDIYDYFSQEQRCEEEISDEILEFTVLKPKVFVSPRELTQLIPDMDLLFFDNWGYVSITSPYIYFMDNPYVHASIRLNKVVYPSSMMSIKGRKR